MEREREREIIRVLVAERDGGVRVLVLVEEGNGSLCVGFVCRFESLGHLHEKKIGPTR